MQNIPQNPKKENKSIERERISVYINKKTKEEWQKFSKDHNISTFSKLIRQSVNSFINQISISEEARSKLSNFKTDTDFKHELKERLTTIKGNLQFFLEKYKNELTTEMTDNIQDILEGSKDFEGFIISKLMNPPLKKANYDILIIEDDIPTIKLVDKYCKSKGFKTKGVLTGEKAIEELKCNLPRIIIIDIILPDISGFDICTLIKNDEEYNNLPVFYLTAVPEEIIEEKMEETKADGYILKPFDLSDLDFIFNSF